MNVEWKNFLVARQACFPETMPPCERFIAPLTHLAVLSISGADAGTFLQGQVTCHVLELNATQSSLGAICNPKGRALAVFLLINCPEGFLMVLPAEQREAVKKRLTPYILRSRVVITDSTEEWCLLGMSDIGHQHDLFSTHVDTAIRVYLDNRQLLLAKPAEAMAIWQTQTTLGFQPADSAYWRYVDILAGLPWLSMETAEAYIPQMLNLDQLGGISFNKGCYTGQEVIARTHYLGKAKRTLLLAQCQLTYTPEPNTPVYLTRLSHDQLDSNDAELTSGKVLSAERQGEDCKLLIVMPICDMPPIQLKLDAQHTLILLEPSLFRLNFLCG